MIALQISEIGTFLKKLLREGALDHFLLQEATVIQAGTYTIDGQISPDYYTTEETEELGLTGIRYLPFHMVRPICFDFLKGTRKPNYFKFVFLLSPENQAKTIAGSQTPFRTEDITGMYLNFVYKNQQLLCTTGISYRIFTMDRSLEQEWDRLVQLFLKRQDIVTEKL